jgi:hypothetical protein
MTKHYSHIDAKQISGITEAQEAIMNNNKTKVRKETAVKPAKSGGSAKVLKFTKTPEHNKTNKRKQA